MILLLVCGVVVGTLGTLVGAGGGFLLVPLLLYLSPTESPERITAISMAVVAANALSGTFAYARMGNVDFYTGIRFALAALPGAILGALSTAYISRLWFDRSLGFTLVLIALFLLYRAMPHTAKYSELPIAELHTTTRLALGCSISAGVGFIASTLGIGGGIIHVPALIYLLGFPVHIATATSHFVLACTSIAAVSEHIGQGSYTGLLPQVGALALGAVGGAQLGARLSSRLRGRIIVLGLAAALILAGIRLVLRSFSG